MQHVRHVRACGHALPAPVRTVQAGSHRLFCLLSPSTQASPGEVLKRLLLWWDSGCALCGFVKQLGWCASYPIYFHSALEYREPVLWASWACSGFTCERPVKATAPQPHSEEGGYWSATGSPVSLSAGDSKPLPMLCAENVLSQDLGKGWTISDPSYNSEVAGSRTGDRGCR